MDLLPIMHPLYNLREVCKQMSLLEDHLTHPRKRCEDCIRKHFLTIEGFLEEAATLDNHGNWSHLYDGVDEWCRELQVRWLDGEDERILAQDLRVVRKKWSPEVFDLRIMTTESRLKKMKKSSTSPDISCAKALNSSNLVKIREYRDFGMTLPVSAHDLREPDTDPVSVAVYKASQLGEGTLVEDTSLEVDGADIGANIKWLVSKLPYLKGRSAKFRSLLAMMIDGRVWVYQGCVPGKIVPPSGGGSSFDPYFLPTGSQLTLGESKPRIYNARWYAYSSLVRGEPMGSFDPIYEWVGRWQNEDIGSGV